MKVAVIGAGIAGLSTAYYLQKNIGAEVDVYERDSEVGGLAATFQLGDKRVEKYYHFVFSHENFYQELAKEVGLEKELIWQESSVGFYCDGKIYPFTTAFDLIKFKPLSFLSRIRLGLSSMLIANYKDVDKMEKMTSEEFMLKYVGKQGWEKIWKPLLKIKFGDNYNKLPAVWIWERIVQRFKGRTGGGSKEVLAYMKGGFHTMNMKLVDIITGNGGKIVLNSEITEIVIENNVCKGVKVNSEFKPYDRVICTAALPVFVDLCKKAPKNYIDPLRKVKYDCVLIAFLVLKKKLSDVFWLNISDNEIPFGGLIEHTNFASPEDYGGKSLVYVSKYCNVNDKYMKMSDEELMKDYMKHIKKIHTDFNEQMVEKYYIFKDRYAQPIWPMEYSKIKPAYKTPIEGLYLADTAQIYPNDRGMNFSVRLGKDVVTCMMQEGK